MSDLDEELKKWQVEKAKAEAQKAKAEAKKAEAEANPSEMEKAQTLAEQEKAIAEAQKAALKAKLPDFDVESPEGKITVDEAVSIECNILACEAVSEIVFHISESIKNTQEETKRVVICDGDDLNNYFSYRTFQNQINFLKEQYEQILGDKKGMVKGERDVRVLDPLSGASTVLSSIVDIASLFRTDVDIKGVKIEIVDEALIAELLRALQRKEIDITPIYPPFRIKVPDKFLTEISELKNCKKEADEKIEEWKDDKLHSEDVKQLKDLNIQYDNIIKALVSVDEKTGVSRLEKLLKGEILNKELESAGTDILYLKMVKAGGNNKAKRSFLRTELAHSGGAIIAYFLLSKEGDIKASKTLYHLSGYRRFDNSGEAAYNNFDTS